MRRLILLLALAAGLAGCAPYHDTLRERFELLPQHYSQFDLRLAWQTREAAGHTVVEGLAQNVRYAFMYDLEIWVTALDPKGKALARSVDYVIPRQLDMDQSAPFAVQLPLALEPGSKLRVTYRYRGSDGGDGDRRFGEGGIPWSQTFYTEVPRR